VRIDDRDTWLGERRDAAIESEQLARRLVKELSGSAGNAALPRQRCRQGRREDAPHCHSLRQRKRHASNRRCTVPRRDAILILAQGKRKIVDVCRRDLRIGLLEAASRLGQLGWNTPVLVWAYRLS